MAFEHIQPGGRWKPKAFELNAILDMASKGFQGQGVRPPDVEQAGVNASPQVVRVYNDTGSDVDRYTCWGIGAPRWVLDTNTNTQEIVFDLVAFNSAETAPAVVQEGIASEGFGTAVICGATLVKVTNGGAEASRYGTPNTSGSVVPTSVQPGNGIWLCSARP